MLAPVAYCLPPQARVSCGRGRVLYSSRARDARPTPLQVRVRAGRLGNGEESEIGDCEMKRCGHPPDYDLCPTCGDYRNSDGCGASLESARRKPKPVPSPRLGEDEARALQEFMTQ